MGKYEPLRDHLAGHSGHQITMTFGELERFVGRLPASARNRRTWWANGSKVQAQAWRGAGWLIQSVDMVTERVTFVRPDSEPVASKQEPSREVVEDVRELLTKENPEDGPLKQGASSSGMTTPEPLPNNDTDWARYWSDHGQPWRKRAEITPLRQGELLNRASTKADVLQGRYPLIGLRIHREDLEWLISRSQGEGGVVDLRGSDVSDEDLSGLPLTALLAGLSGPDWRLVDQGTQSQEERDALFNAAAVNFQRCNLTNADLRESSMTYADLRGAKLSDCRLDGADLFRVNLGGEFPANLHGAILDRRTRLNEAIMASDSGVAPRLFDVQWNGASLSGIDWSIVKKVADEKRSYHKARRRPGDGWSVSNNRRIIWYSEAAQTYRQLAMALRFQGMNDQARRFTYRAEVARFWSLLHSLTRFRQWGAFAFSLLLGVISGWGYRLYRSALLYVATIFIFANLYRITSDGRYNWREATVLSIIAFHGRAFYPSDNYGLGTTFAAVGAAEAFVGLFIEAIVIATLTRRLFSD